MPTQYTSAPGRIESFLATVPLLADLEPSAIQSLAAGATIHSFDVGETIVRQGEAADAFYVILKGTVRAVSTPVGPGPAREVSLTKLGGGDHFGEVGLVERAPRTATCRVSGEEPAFVVRIAGTAVEPVVAAHPRLRETIHKLGDFYRAWNFLKVSTGIGDVLAPEPLRALTRLLELRSCARDSVVVREGDPRAPLVLVRSGFVRVSRRGVPVGLVGEGRHWGEEALLRGEPAPGDLVAAADDVEVLLAPREPLRRLLESEPALARFLEQNPCAPVEASVVKPLPRSFNVKDQDPTVYLGLAAVPARAASAPPSGAPQREPRAAAGPINRFPLVRQHDEADCGPAAVAMIARFWGKRVGIGRIRDLARASSDGASLAGLAEAAQGLGFLAHGARVSADALDGKPLPAVLHWSGSHFVVLYRLDGRHAWVADPAVGLRKLTRAELASAYSGALLVLEPTERLDGVRAAKGGLGRLLEQLAPHGRVLVEIALASLVVDVLGLAGPLGAQAVIDRVLAPGEARWLPVLVLGLALVALARIATQALRATLVADLSQRLDLRALLKLFFHVLSLPLAFFRLRRPGEVLHRFAESARVRSVLAGSALFAAFDLVLVGLAVLVMVAESPRLALAVLGFLPLSALATLAFTPRLRRLSERALAANAEQEALLVDSVQAVETVKALALERAVRWRWEAQFARYLRALHASARAEIALGSVVDAIGAAGTLVLLGYGASLVLARELSVGQLVAFQGLFASALAPVGNLVGLWERIQEANLSLERVDSLLDCEPEESGGPAALVDPRALLKGRIRCDRVFFRYAPEAPFALEGLTLEIAAGTTVGILGRSGSGKTTLARLLQKLDLPTEGHVTFDDLDVTSIAAQGLRRAVGVVAQEVHLFRGTIAENVAPGHDEIDRARLEEVGRTALVHEFVGSLPQGWDTVLGEGGSGLSGGQRARLAVARALYPHPRVLVLDEATSALDLEAEERLLSSLRAATAGRTTILLSHRASAVRRADRILVLDRGRIVEDGTHEELCQARGLYRELAAREGLT